MGDNSRPSVDLIEADVEAVVLGSLLVYPDALPALAVELRAEWFADSAGRLVAEAILGLHRDGHKPSAAALAASLPATLDGAGSTRSGFIASIMTKSMPLGFLSAYVATLRDRWARRQLVAQAEALQLAAIDVTADPFETASTLVSEADNITAVQHAIDAGSLGRSVDEMLESIAAPKHRGVTTGIRSLDRALNGYPAGKLYVVAGRPGMGKSAFMCSSLWRSAEAGNGVDIYSLEMGRQEVTARCMADAVNDVDGPFFGTILRGEFGSADQDALLAARERILALPLHIDASPNLNFSQIAARARRRRAAFEAQGIRLAVVAIDHMGLVEPSDRYHGNKVAEAGEISRAAKFLAKELDCCVLLLCQLNRGVEGRDDKRPTLADLRWSGDIEQDADVVAFVYRPSYYLAQRPDADADELRRARFSLEFLIRKNRNGETSDVLLWCSIAHSSMRDAANG